MQGALNQTSCIARYCHRCVRLYIQQVSGGREPQLTSELPEINSASKAFCFLFSFPFGTQLVWQVRETSSSGESGAQVVLLLELLLAACSTSFPALRSPGSSQSADTSRHTRDLKRNNTSTSNSWQTLRLMRGSGKQLCGVFV